MEKIMPPIVFYFSPHISNWSSAFFDCLKKIYNLLFVEQTYQQQLTCLVIGVIFGGLNGGCNSKWLLLEMLI
jgi:hypothetical protein